MLLTRRSLLVPAMAALVLPRLTVAQSSLVWPNPDWQLASPESAAIDPFTLAAVDERVPFETPDLSALLVVRGGRLVHERYFNLDADDPVDVRSITKSVTGLLTGIAIEKGLIPSLDTTIGEIIPDRIPAGADPRVAEVTIRQLLTMSSGIEWGQYTDWTDLTTSENWVERVLGQPVTGIPGQTYVYNTGGSHVLGVAVATAAGMPLEEFAEERLFQPLGINSGTWNRSPQGEVNGGSGLALTGRDAARLGLLALRSGAWKNEQIVPAEFVQEGTSWLIQGDSTGGNEGYGFQWWITQTGTGYPAFFGLGYGGQHLFVAPGLDLVIVALVDRRVTAEELRSPRPLIETIVAGTAPLN